MSKAVIMLVIDTKLFRDESGEELTDDLLRAIGQQVNTDARTIQGYEAWTTGFVTSEDITDMFQRYPLTSGWTNND